MAEPGPTIETISRSNDDARRAIVFLAVKAAIFFGVPMVASLAAVLLLLK